MNYPLHLSFKLLAIGSKISITDSTGRPVFYVKQKAFKLKEYITVFSDETQNPPLFYIRADKILDFNARYNFTDVQGNIVGSIKRQGIRSLWSARYDIFEGDKAVLTISEENPWIKILDELLGSVPFIGFAARYFIQPSYLLKRPNGTVVMRFKKQPALFESHFAIENHAESLPGEESVALLGIMMAAILERHRG